MERLGAAPARRRPDRPLHGRPLRGRTGPGSRLGEDGLLALARRHGALSARAFVDTLVDEAAEAASPYGGLADDVAVLHLGWGRKTPR